ncbi:MAG: ABC transporter ATP-binding protein, partial [Erysipelotrichales bacterium]|nr:ABC transporter ATP-binding protein [Erysipelotrichales bacterium]
MVSATKTIQAYAREDEIVKHFDAVNNNCVDSYYNADYYGSMVGPCVNFVNNLSLTLISVFGAILYLYGQISLGNISSFVLYSRKFSGPINEAANIIAELQSAMAAAERVFKLLDEVEELKDAEDAVDLVDVHGDVELQHVDFGYEEGKPILKDVSLHAKSGQTIAVVGPTGAGKTTLINLLMRFYDANSGTICIDGHDIMHVTRRSLRKAFAMVLQETWLFEGTIYDNIVYGSDNVTEEDVRRVAKAAHIDTFIERLPDGYQTIINENGTNISKGQKQLITIARAMLMDTEMLILDEATSNVDTNTEKLIQSAMLELMSDKTCFVIAHRLSTIQNADCILVVRDGNIIEQGTHEELLENNGFYASLYNSQYE